MQSVRTSVEVLGDAIAAEVRLALGSGDDVGTRVAVPAMRTRGAARLAERIVDAVNRSLRADVRSVAPLGSADTLEATIRAAAGRGCRVIVSVELQVDRGHLVASPQLLRLPPGFASAFTREAERVSVAQVRVPLDAQLRTFVAPLPRTTPTSVRTSTAPLTGRGYLSVGAVDLDHDGVDELALLGPDRVEVVRAFLLPHGRARVQGLGVLPLDGLMRAAAPSRRPVGTLVRHGDTLVGRTSEHAVSFELGLRDGTLGVWPADVCADDGYPVDGGCARRVPGRDYFQPEIVPRGTETPADAVAGFLTRVARPIRQVDGTVLSMDAIVTPRGRLSARAGDARRGSAVHGAALALADIDHDGSAELLASSDALPGRGDRLALLRLGAGASLTAVWTSAPIDGAVLVAGAGDIDGDAQEELVAIEEARDPTASARLWVIR
jgi:hypothetical protein